MATEFTTEPLINYQGQNLDFASICQALEQIGVKAGDDICVHSSLMRLGKILVTPKQLLDTLIAAFREVIGPQGTLIMPTFTYSYCHQQIYDVLHTPSTMGILTEYPNATAPLTQFSPLRSVALTPTTTSTKKPPLALVSIAFMTS